MNAFFSRWLRPWRPHAETGAVLAGPIRGELLGAEHLAERARAVARGQRLEPSRRGPRRALLLARLTDTRRILAAAQHRLAATVAGGAELDPAGEWLLDNFHVVQEQLREIHESLPRDYYHELPALASGPLAGYPRVYELVITLISHSEARLDPENVDRFVGAFQEEAELSIGELWALPAMLRLGLIESVRRMALRTIERLDQVEAADRWAERLLREHAEGSAALGPSFEALVHTPHALSPIFVSRFLQQFRLAAGAAPPLLWVERWLAEEGLTPDGAATRATDRIAMTTLTMANSITSLRGIAQRDWRGFVERQSAMERTLREDPSGHYPRMSFATRDAYRHVVERVGKRSGRSGAEVAGHAIALARAGAAVEPRRGHVGFYLVDAGRGELEAALGVRASFGEALFRGVRRHPHLVLFGGLGAASALALAGMLWLAGPGARAGWGGLAVVLLLLLPASDIAVNLVNQMVTVLVPPRVLPRLDFRLGIAEECRTAVVVPILFDSVAGVEEALSHLEVQFLANRDDHLSFALLADFKDSDSETRPSDAAILAAAEAGVAALNARYAPDHGNLFYLFHRPRRWNPRQGVWMGWERKRGKLADFNRVLRGGARDAFSVIVGDLAPLRRVRYVITLDADTLLPPGTAAALVGTLAHPLNAARYDAARGRVVGGYGILQPRVEVSLASAHRSRFAAIYSGHPGVDPYTTAVSDVYQDLYGEGSFTGKGIYDVDAFERAIAGRFPENALLSHDLIEGSYARAGLASDLTVYDDYPTSYLTFSRRKHRWIRGDWQLLPWLLPRVPTPAGRERNPLPLLARWKLLDNLRRSLVELSQFALLGAGWTLLPGSPLRWTLLGAGAIAAPWVVALLLAALRPPRDKSWRAYYVAVAQDAATSAQQFGLALLFLPHQAWLSVDAIARTLGRLVTRRQLLEWETASRAERSREGTPREVWRAMGPAVATSSLLVAVSLRLLVAGREGGHPWWLAALLLPLGVLWGVAPAIAWALSVPRSRTPRVLSQASRDLAVRYARLHWEYFRRFVAAETHWLAPDNVQEDATPPVALRTSPTNLGLQLLATVSAYDLGLLGLEELTVALERAFQSLARLPRFRGHFYNWYGLEALEVLEPAYVSTVDSGNLAGHLLALRQACAGVAEAVRAESDDVAVRLEAIGTAAERYALEMDFRLLYDDARKLFSIGYHPGSHALDVSSYDLLASEARLASFVAIAKNDVPVGHWFRLGRGLIHAGGDTALVSWSGSMFEYLMPLLVLHSYPATMLGQTYQGALGRQIAYGAARGVPWGISESAYNVRDRHGTYQYRAFGVPGLALKRGLGRDLVVAPYASGLAAMLDPERALANLQVLERLGLLGDCGFYDAADYTRPEPGRPFAVVRAHMAHHIGMTLVSLDNTLRGGIWQQRFHSDPRVRATALLLDERVPRRLQLAELPARPDEAPPAPLPARPVVREVDTPDGAQPRVALLGHAPYTVMLSQAGGGYSRYEGLAVTRWRADGTRDHTGQFCYLKDLSTGRVWSAGHQPVAARADGFRALLATDRVTLERIDGELETRTEIVVIPDDAAEVRQVTVTNTGSHVREVELTSYGEIVLAPPDQDRAHPAFSNLFVETEWHEWCTALTASRRPRSAEEARLWCVHVVDTGKERVGPVSCETDRARFVGRGRSPRNPVALDQEGALSGTTGAVLDPVFALRTRVRLAPGQSACVAFTTLVTTSRERAFELADRYHHPRGAQRALELAWTAAQLELQALELTPAAAAAFQDLAGHLFYAHAGFAAPGEERRAAAGSRERLWATGISGDWPILLARIDSVDGLATLRQLFAAHRYCRRRGMTVDLVVLNGQRHSYQDALTDRITESLIAAGGSGLLDAPGGVFVRARDLLAPETLGMIAATARVRIACDGRTLEAVLSETRAAPAPAGEEPPPLPRRAERSGAAATSLVQRLAQHAAGVIRAGGAPPPRAAPAPEPDSAPLRFDNGFGGLTPEGDYRIRVQGDRVPPAPWANVIANPLGGFVVSERGAGFTWAGNSYFFRLTPWHNDPVSDPPGEVFYLRDEESGAVWSPTPAPAGRDAAHRVEHGPGRSSFTQQYAGIASRLTLGLAPDAAVKLARLRLHNPGPRPRQLTLTAYVEWTLGVQREHTQHQVLGWFDAGRGACFAQNRFEPEFASWVAFVALSEPVLWHSGDRRAFLGRNGSLADPAGLSRAAPAGGGGPELDPCAALSCALPLAPGETREVVVLLGAAPDREQAQRAVERYRDLERATQAMDATVQQWGQRLSVIQVRTPEPAFDALLNRWSLYQTLSCRIWGRSAVYQSSGGYGFRDQLQDVLALLYADPGIAREHLLRAAGRQFVEGDVQHWWHPESGRGVRTRFSDDLVWLPYAADQYIRVTGDAGVLDESAGFLRMRALAPDESEVYERPDASGESASLYEHCLRALRRACTAGPHGLPLIGSGDWNDGLNRVGIGGTGESIWLGWFLTATLRGFATQAEARGDAPVAAELRAQADRYVAAIETHGWDGAWYRRAYFDDGTPLGSAANTECQIDSIAQSWSVLSGAGAPERQAAALRALEEQLVREDARLLMLLTPPFDHLAQDPGYIKGYVPGVRENGAQYTHAALWAVAAVARRGRGDRAFELYQMLNPLTHAATPEDVAVYKVEPYVVAADVYTAKGALGRGGWTWYTGSASWMYRVGLEELLGFRQRGATLRIEPRVPAHWPELAIEYRYGTSVYSIVVHRPGALSAGAIVRLDGQVLDTGEIPLLDDGGRHAVLLQPTG